jgi:hypothetical protein
VLDGLPGVLGVKAMSVGETLHKRKLTLKISGGQEFCQ